MTPIATRYGAAPTPGEILTAKLSTLLKVPVQVTGEIVGPQLTRYEVKLLGDVRMRDVARTGDDLAYALGASPITVHAPLSGHSERIAVEVPVAERRIVRVSEMPSAVPPLAYYAGVDMNGKPFLVNLAEGPHWAFVGQTGAGKSMGIHVMVYSLISRFGPEDLCFVMIDPKQVELPWRYGKLPHQLAPVATTVEDSVDRLEAVQRFTDLRFSALEQMGARDIEEMNQKLEAIGRQRLPRVIVIIDEVADLMMASRKRVEGSIVRIAQKARAVGIHLVLATQSPRVAVLTGLLKANLPSRVCFSVASQTDSRVAIDRNGAELLLGNGDALMSLGGAPPQRFQGAYVSSDEITAACARWL